MMMIGLLIMSRGDTRYAVKPVGLGDGATGFAASGYCER